MLIAAIADSCLSEDRDISFDCKGFDTTWQSHDASALWGVNLSVNHGGIPAPFSPNIVRQLGICRHRVLWIWIASIAVPS
jgi:hypothetical protein